MNNNLTKSEMTIFSFGVFLVLCCFFRVSLSAQQDNVLYRFPDGYVYTEKWKEMKAKTI